MKTNLKLCNAVISALVVSLGSASAQLIDLQIGTSAGGTTDGGGSTAPSTQMTGAAALGSAGDIWNFLNVPFAIQGNPQSGALSDVTGASTPITFGLYQPSNYIYGQVNPQGSASDTPALLDSSVEAYNLGGGSYYIAQLNNMSAYSGYNFTLVVYAANPTPQTESIYFTSAYNGVAVTGGNTGSTLTTSSADRNLSGGEGDTYATFTGTFSGNNTVNFIISDGNAQRGNDFNGIQLEITPAPEPTSLALAAMGGIGMLTLIRRRKN